MTDNQDSVGDHGYPPPPALSAPIGGTVGSDQESEDADDEYEPL